MEVDVRKKFKGQWTVISITLVKFPHKCSELTLANSIDKLSQTPHTEVSKCRWIDLASGIIDYCVCLINSFPCPFELIILPRVSGGGREN